MALKLSALSWFMISQLVTVLGTSFSVFAMNVWVYKQGGGISEYALVSIAAYLPGAIASFFAGSFIENIDKRRVIFLADAFQAVCTLALAFMWFADMKAIYGIVVIVAMQSMLESFQWVATQSLTLYLSKGESGLKTHAYLETIRNVVRVSAPGLAAVLASFFGLGFVFSLDFVCFIIGTILLFKVHLPSIVASTSPPSSLKALLSSAMEGLRWMMKEKTMLNLLFFFSLINLAIGVITTASPLFFIGTLGDVGYGLCLSMFSAGMIFGGLAITKIKYSKTTIFKYLLGFQIAYGLVEIILGFAIQKPIFLASMFGLGFLVSASNVLNATLWQDLVPAGLSARVFSLRRSIAMGLTPLAAILAPPLVLLFTDSYLALSLKSILGLPEGDATGPIRAVFICLGALICCFSVSLFSLKKIKDKFNGINP